MAPDVARCLEEELDLRQALKPRGAVVQVGDGVARAVGLRDVGSEELVAFDSGALGIASELAPDYTGIVLLGNVERVRASEGVEATGSPLSLPVRREILGRVLDPLAQPLDERPAPAAERQPIFRPAPTLIERGPVDRPLLTGVMVIDSAIPIGRGQRQLIVGDRNVGKTALALDIVAAQRAGDVVCVYVVIGQPMSRVLSIREALEKAGALSNTVIIASDASDSPGLQYLAPYAGTTVAEYFRDLGQDALIVYDDLTKHADAYRELALLLGRPPGREAFPGDIFYIHAQLLERATALAKGEHAGSITAFPIVETTDSDISSYIPTNLISITDGQVYLDTTLFVRNQRPAVDIGRSVSRVGGTAQRPSLRTAARNLRIVMSQFEALESLTRVGLDVDPATRKAVERGRIMREILRQPRFTVRTAADQILALTAVTEGWLDTLSPSDASKVVWAATQRVRVALPDVVAALDSGAEIPIDDWKERLRDLVQGHLQERG
ncbi:MAG: F0F1 ATP synthase subunit alpha [Myxococcales bacterium]